MVACVLISSVVSAQVLGSPKEVSPYNADSVRRVLEQSPYFSLYKDNYFVVGTMLDEEPTKENTDAKFQLSIQQRLTRSVLPFDTYLYIQYTQQAYWNVIQKSMPIRDINFNPGFGIGHLIIYKNRYKGKAFVMMEHESNGKAGVDSRSWNRLSLGVMLDLNKNFQMQVKAWHPFVDGRNNQDILYYSGIMQFAGNFRTNCNRFHLGVVMTQRKYWFKYNARVELSYKFNRRGNQYLFLQYYNGFGENLLEYKQYKNVLRFGFVIKPGDFSTY